MTSTSQPLDQGIISSVKRNYRISVLKVIAQNHELFIENTRQPRKKSGLCKGGSPDILDAITLLNASLQKVSSELIAKCWKRANIALVPTVQINTNIITEQFDVDDNEKEIQIIYEQLSNLKFDQFEQNIKRNKIRIIQDDVQEWLDIEMDQSVVMEVANQQSWEQKEDNESKDSGALISIEDVDTTIPQSKYLEVQELCTKLN